VSVIVELFTVLKSIGSLKVSIIVLVTATPVAALAGLTLTTDGFVVFAVPELPVEKLLVKVVIGLPV